MYLVDMSVILLLPLLCLVSLGVVARPPEGGKPA